MATIVIGDIHGDFPTLDDLLGKVEGALAASDTVIFLGDYIDRGPGTRECIARIVHLRASTAATVVGLAGNHEEWMLHTLRDPTRHSWLLGMEAFATIESYSPDAARALRAAAKAAGPALYEARIALPYHLFFESLPADHLSFFENLKPFWQTDDALCTHGGCDPGEGPLESQSARALVWGTDGFQRRYQEEPWLVYGHWNNARRGASGRPEPIVIGRTIGIDTIAHGVLTALRLPDGTVFQSGTAATWRLAEVTMPAPTSTPAGRVHLHRDR